MVKRYLPVLVIFILLIYIFIITRTKRVDNNPIPQNLVIISIDTLRTDHMGVYGYNKSTTPNIDGWAKDAYIFPKTYTMTPLTFPTFLTLMTGKSPFQTSVYNHINTNDMSKPTKTLATKFKENGYKTGAFVTNTILKPKITEIDQGFDTYNYNETSNTNDKEYNNTLNQSLNWLESNKEDKFFLWVHLMDPHFPYEPPDTLKCKFNEKMCSDLQTYTYEDLEKRRKSLEKCHINNNEVSQKDIDIFQSLYDGEIYQADLMVGKILDKLKANHLNENTLVIIYGDHGEGFDHNYYFFHSEVLYNSAINIPFILKYPGLKPNGNNYQQTLIQNNDIYPTLLDIFRISHKESEIDGISFNNIFSGNKTNKDHPNRSTIYAMNMELSKFTIIDGNYKFIYTLPNKIFRCLYLNQEEELYDLVNDPNELSNLVKIKGDIHNKLKQKLLDYLSSNPIQNYAIPRNVTLPEDVKAKLKKMGY